MIHEGGHYLAALYFGKKLKFRFMWGRFYVPRYVWTMPWMDYWKQRIVALAGFGMEFAFAALLLLIQQLRPFGACYTLVALLHLVAYPWYAGDTSDFKWLARKKKQR